MKRKCLEGSSYFTGSPVVFQTILKIMLAGVAMDSRAGQRGWSTNWHVLHFERESAPIWTDGEAMLRDRHDPIESRRRNRRMTIVYLICRDRRPLEQR